MQQHSLTIERVSHDLRGIAFAPYQDQASVAWFVEGALLGETVNAVVSKAHANRIDAVAVDVVDASPARITPECVHYEQCGGCQLQHMAVAAQRAQKQDSLQRQLQQALRSDALPATELIYGEAWHYRRRARLSARWQADKKHLALGFRAAQSQQIIDIESCLVLEPQLAAMLPVLREQLAQWARPRALGHIELMAADNGQAVVLRLLEAPNEQESQLLKNIAQATGATILLQLEEAGEPVVWEGVLSDLRYRHAATGTELSIAPNDFVQANSAVNSLMIDRVLDALELSKTDRVLELFSGVGNFSLPIATRAQQVDAYELSERLISRAQMQANSQSLAVVCREVDLANVKAVTGIAHSANKLLLDPPRAGADIAVKHLVLDGIERIVYVSCNPSTLARDVASLGERGYALQEVVCVDMFPQTAHIEAIAVLVKQAPSAIKARTKAASDRNAKATTSKNGFKRLKR